MLSRLFGRGRERLETATALYGAIVAQARTAALYADLGVPDTVSGRFEMVILHAFLVFDRLQAGSAAEHEISQGAFDLFCSDMDRSLRELGVGDLGVPKRMRQVGEAFYGRTRAYLDSISSGDEAALAAALNRNVFKALADEAPSRALAGYVLASVARLADVAPAAIARELPPFPDPAAFAASAVDSGMSGPALSRPFAVADVRGRIDIEIIASPQELAALAGEYDLLAAHSMMATVTLTAEPGGGVDVSGRVKALIEQACVVTLDPVRQEIDEPFDVRFVRLGSPELEVEVPPHAEIIVDPAAPDPPEVLTGKTIDLGQIVEEAFVLAIDPYPRAPGAALPQIDGDGDTAIPPSPFAALAALKHPKG